MLAHRSKKSMMKVEFQDSGEVFFRRWSWYGTNNCFKFYNVVNDCSHCRQQVSNPSIQFMLYETLLKKLKKRRASSKKGSNDVSALEVVLLHFLVPAVLPIHTILLYFLYFLVPVVHPIQTNFIFTLRFWVLACTFVIKCKWTDLVHRFFCLELWQN